VSLVVEAQLREHRVVLQSSHNGQDPLPGYEVGLNVDTGDVLVDLQHFCNGDGRTVISMRVGQTKRLHHGVVLEGLSKTGEGLRCDVLDVVQIDFYSVRVIVFNLFQSILNNSRISARVNGSW
jgi:hypothetical protein